ncbi:hypothetical protein [Chamaesiphon minutus]|uniref:Cation diffusion facilitator family transporter n=1 Tax=Chamaesiphon minutus (strain ATCC 27169 / PCC 6605) TaxID=1173020 RepID=K9UP78_CHAP6|nr:hypothetical protein [Chamaesiphon minutus]AFY96892.1 hypothetical protein Cha6605_6053 [Chamaesiphon minutus PCC 6605]
MTHNHGSEHPHGSGNYNRAFITSVTLNTLFVAIEAFYGIAANSLALIADAAVSSNTRDRRSHSVGFAESPARNGHSYTPAKEVA